VNLPPLIRTRPFGSVRILCSRDALTVEPGAPPGRWPAVGYPRKPRPRPCESGSRRGCHLHSPGSRHLGQGGLRSVGGTAILMIRRPDHPSIRPRDQEADTVRYPQRQPYSLGIRSRRTTMWVPRLGWVSRSFFEGNGPSARPVQTPVASMMEAARTSSSAPVSSSRTVHPTMRPPSSIPCRALARVTARAPCARAVRRR